MKLSGSVVNADNVFPTTELRKAIRHLSIDFVFAFIAQAQATDRTTVATLLREAHAIKPIADQIGNCFASKYNSLSALDPFGYTAYR